MELTKVDLDSLAGGVVPELFAHELDKVVRNIADVNAKAVAPRSITVKVTLEPKDDTREQVDTKVEFKTVLAGPPAVAASMFVTRHHGELQAVTTKPDSLGLFGTQPAVVPMQQNGGGEEGEPHAD